ncbi:hypothetical protein NQ317_017723 [Molorchus minor]|uniref:HTH psq-type domain-containing protein n=1 Tax=Molorchus minor TaxID=1323400 RepID=A0ABQ9J6B2_9CUCU|nr:hypothetical protein NQ317_017723 [Molorchus minor]
MSRVLTPSFVVDLDRSENSNFNNVPIKKCAFILIINIRLQVNFVAVNKALFLLLIYNLNFYSLNVNEAENLGHIKNRPRSGRLVVPEDVELNLLLELQENPHLSSRAIAANNGISQKICLEH